MADPLDRYREIAGDRWAEVIASDAVMLGPHLAGIDDDEIRARLSQAQTSPNRQLNRGLRELPAGGRYPVTPGQAHAIALIAAREKDRKARAMRATGELRIDPFSVSPERFILGEDALRTLAPYERVIGEHGAAAIKERAAGLVPWYEDRRDLHDSQLAEKIGPAFASLRPPLETIRAAATDVALRRELDHRTQTREQLGFEPWQGPSLRRTADAQIQNVQPFRSAGALIGARRIAPLEAHRKALAASTAHLDTQALHDMASMLSGQIEPINGQAAMATQRQEQHLQQTVAHSIRLQCAAGTETRKRSPSSKDRQHELPDQPPHGLAVDRWKGDTLAADCLDARRDVKSALAALEEFRACGVHLGQWAARNADHIARVAGVATNLEIAHELNASQTVYQAIRGQQWEQVVEPLHQMETDMSREPPDQRPDIDLDF
jgi:hypothetical protein